MDVDPQSVMMMSGLALYAGIFFLPFIQEDAAVIAAKGAAEARLIQAQAEAEANRLISQSITSGARFW